MKVLVSVASKHGATAEMATRIAAVLSTAGAEAVVMAPEDVTSLERFDAAIVGSGVYAGHWLDAAKDLLAEHRDAFARRPVWLFSSGPIGDPPRPADEPIDAAGMQALVGARGHRVFPGLLERRRLGFGERALVAALRAPEGDFRPWPEIEAWAQQIAGALLDEPVAAR